VSLVSVSGELPPLVLASKSPRRKVLLKQIGLVSFDMVGANINESIKPNERPRDAAVRLALSKAKTVSLDRSDAFVLGADTIVARGQTVFHKPANCKEAYKCLKNLSGRKHQVYTGVAVCRPDGRSFTKLAISIVTFKRLSGEEISSYIATEEWRGMAGGYAIQGKAAAIIKHISGSYSNIIGLPLHETMQLLSGIGFPIVHSWE
tara:strand:+ start:2053 stop:2667 length:615 start_codon:yes stop_codon:yes gene_type:complete